MFHCIKHEGTGGRTLLVDGFYAAEKLREQSPENFELLTRVPIRHEYIENSETHRNHMIGIGPVLSVYPWSNEIFQIRYVSISIHSVVLLIFLQHLSYFHLMHHLLCIILFIFVRQYKAQLLNQSSTADGSAGAFPYKEGALLKLLEACF